MNGGVTNQQNSGGAAHRRQLSRRDTANPAGLKRVRTARQVRIRQPESSSEEFPLMGKFGFTFLLAFIAVGARADELFPSADGTTWEYELREEFGGPAAAAPATVSSIVRIGRESHEGKDFLKIETIVDDAVAKTELATADEKGVVCYFRAGKDGRVAKLDPPQVIVPPDLKPGTAWDSDGEVAGMEIH